MFLALDTVFGQCSVAIVTASGEVVTSATQAGHREQTQQILPMVDAALSQSQLSLDKLKALVFNRGPGAFSGIRINTAVIQALSVAHDLPCVGVSSLQVLAQAAYDQFAVEACYAAHDARMKQVYIGEFALVDGLMQPKRTAIKGRSGHERMDHEGLNHEGLNFEWLLDYESQTPLNLPIVGDGGTLLSSQNDQSIVDSLLLDAAILGRLGAAKFARAGGVTADQALPIYLRNHAWKTLKEQGKA